MKNLLSILFATSLLFQADVCMAQQSQSFGTYEIHYNVLNSNLIPAQVARGYDIKRSSNRALLNITIMDTSGGDYGTPIKGSVTTKAQNLTGQRRDIEMREINDPEGGIYYIGELPIHNMETFTFTVTIKVEDEPKPFELKFQQQFYTE